jgi:hypothetical protein
MNCERCNDLGWIITERNGLSGATMCNCRAEAQKLPGKPLREEVAIYLVEALCQVLGYAPDATGQPVLVRALMDMCCTEEDLRYVVNRACALYTKWSECGVPGLRQILCARCVPKDGITLMSTAAYPDGVPTLKPPDRYVMAALPLGRAASADLAMERAVLKLAEIKKLS